mgnify:CR=1 FL=1
MFDKKFKQALLLKNVCFIITYLVMICVLSSILSFHLFTKTPIRNLVQKNDVNSLALFVIYDRLIVFAFPYFLVSLIFTIFLKERSLIIIGCGVILYEVIIPIFQNKLCVSLFCSSFLLIDVSFCSLGYLLGRLPYYLRNRTAKQI